MDEYARFETLIKETCDAKTLWPHVAANIDALSRDETFDGGFVVNALVGKNAQEEDFAKTGVSAFCNRIRSIRNGLSHGRDQRTSTVIAPTRQNSLRLRPWLPLMAAAAGQAVLMSRVL